MNTIIMLLAIIMSAAGVAAADDANVFTGSNASTIIAQALVKNGAGDDLTAHINEVRDEEQLATASGAISAEVDKLNIDKEHKNWKATLLFKADGRNLAPMNVSGNYEELASVPVLKRQVRVGETIAAEDIEFDKQPARHLRKNTATDTKDLIGKSPKHVISDHRPIRLDEIASPSILIKGAHITMIYRSRNLEIRTVGEALDSGAKGDVIRIKNLASKAVIDGVIETNSSVRVTSPDDTAEAM